MPRKAAPPKELVAERKRRQSGKVRQKTLNSELEIGLLVAYDFMGGERWLINLAKTRPALFVQLMGKYAGKQGAEAETEVRFIVQQFNVQAEPIPGVLNSPIAGHIAGPRLAASNGEVIDAEVKGD